MLPLSHTLRIKVQTISLYVLPLQLDARIRTDVVRKEYLAINEIRTNTSAWTTASELICGIGLPATEGPLVGVITSLRHPRNRAVTHTKIVGVEKKEELM